MDECDINTQCSAYFSYLKEGLNPAWTYNKVGNVTNCELYTIYITSDIWNRRAKLTRLYISKQKD